MAESRRRERPTRLNQNPGAVTWAREMAGLTKRQLAAAAGFSEQLMGEIESGWRNATAVNLLKIAAALKCPVVVLERDPFEPQHRDTRAKVDTRVRSWRPVAKAARPTVRASRARQRRVTR